MQNSKFEASFRLIAAVSLSALAGCSDSDDDPPAAVSLEAFVIQQLAATGETTEPVDVNAFTFVSSEDGTAFDALLPAP